MLERLRGGNFPRIRPSWPPPGRIPHVRRVTHATLHFADDLYHGIRFDGSRRTSNVECGASASTITAPGVWQQPVPQQPAVPAPPLARPMSLQQSQPARVRSGVFLFGDVGIAGHASSRDNSTVSGGGLGLRLAAGAMVKPAVALFGGLSHFESAGVSLEQDGLTIDSEDLSLSMNSFFVGGRAYTTSSFYFESTLGSAKQTLKDEISGEGVAGKTGWILHLGAGKEWTFQSGLALALGLRVGGGRVPAADAGNDPVVGHFALSMAVGFAGGQ